MFVTRSDPLKLPPVTGRPADPNARSWRSVRIATQQPFFLATFESEVAGEPRLDSFCIMWETDLLHHMKEVGVRLVDLMYLAPPWCAGTGAWTARYVASVWVGSYEGAEVPVFIDSRGQEFCVDLQEIGLEDVQGRSLVAEIRRPQTPT